MKKNLNTGKLGTTFLCFCALLLAPPSSPAAGSLTPPGAPAPAMKSLQEIEPRTIISSVPFTISAPGSYYLSNNLTVATGNAITIATNNVTLDLNGFTLSSTAAGANGSGVLINGAGENISIKDGVIQGGVTDNGSGSYGGPGFANGVYCPFGNNIFVSKLAVLGCLSSGIYLNGNSTLVEDCLVYAVGSRGISANIVVGSTASDCDGDGIDASSVSDSYGQTPYGGIGINAENVNNCYGVSGSGTGINAGSSAHNSFGLSSSGYYGIYAVTVVNCYGTGYSTNSIGILSYDATGCYGYGGSDGIYSYGTATGCYGSGAYGDGIYAYAAENCFGNCQAPSGSTPYASIDAYTAHNCYGNSYYQNGLEVILANNCYGYSSYGSGIIGFSSTGTSVENCYGYSYNGIGISTYLANNSFGESQNSDGMDAHGAINSCGYTHAGVYGLLCSGAANNCLGYIIGGAQNFSVALQAVTANNSFGVNSSTGTGGDGLYADVANNCVGYSYSVSGAGLRSYYSATGCLGYASANGAFGVDADIAIGCYGSASGSGAVGLIAYLANSCVYDASVITYKYNMP